MTPQPCDLHNDIFYLSCTAFGKEPFQGFDMCEIVTLTREKRTHLPRDAAVWCHRRMVILRSFELHEPSLSEHRPIIGRSNPHVLARNVSRAAAVSDLQEGRLDIKGPSIGQIDLISHKLAHSVEYGRMRYLRSSARVRESCRPPTVIVINVGPSVYPLIDPKPHFASQTFEDKIIIITGGSTGIGAVTALYYAKSGAKVAIVARRADRLEERKEAIEKEVPGAKVLAIAGDISDPEVGKRVVKAVVDAWGGVDIVVSNSAIMSSGPISSTSVSMSVREICADIAQSSAART